MEGGNIYDKIQEIFGELPGQFSILEEKIDIDLQMEYFEYSRTEKKDLDEKAVMAQVADIQQMDLDTDHRKRVFTRLASVENVEAYRAIEAYLKAGHRELREWAVLALQESRMLLESRLLEENQVFISTGLGGRESKLRYFVVLIKKDPGDFSPLQQKIIRNEFELALKKHNAEIEKLEFQGSYATLLNIIPLDIALKELFQQAIKECNQYGNFLRNNFIVTNVRELNQQEIEDFLARQQQTGPDD